MAAFLANPTGRKPTRPDHGTVVRYTGGCRCDDCREASRVYTRQRRRAKGEPPKSRAAELGFDAQEEAILIELGWLDPRPFDLPEIALALGFTTQAASLCIKRALRKLRTNPELAKWYQEA